MIKFSPPMVALANIAEMWMNDKSFTQQLQLVLNDAIALNASEQQMLKFDLQGMKKINVILNAEAEAEEQYRKIDELLGELKNIIDSGKSSPVVDDLLNGIEEALILKERAISAMKQEDIKLRLSRYPVVNDYLQACLNVYGESETDDILPYRQQLMIGFVEDTEEEFNDYLEIRPQASQWQPHFINYMANIKEGIGGIQVFLEEHNSQNLIAGAAMVQENAKTLHDYLKDMHEKIDSLFSFSKIDELERLWIRRYRVKNGDVKIESPEIEIDENANLSEEEIEKLALEIENSDNDNEYYLDDVLNEVNNLIQRHESTVVNFDKTFLPENVKEYYRDSLKQLVEYERQCFTNLDDSDESLIALKDAIENFENTMATILEYARTQSFDISKAANINEYCDIIAGVYFGTAPIRILRRVNNFMIEKFSEVQEPAPETVEFINLQGEALRMVNDALTSNNFSALPLAMEKMKQGVSGILNICKEREEAEKANEAKEAGNTILCIKCGTANPATASHCSKCNASLAFAKTMMAQETPSEGSLLNISQDGSGDAMPSENIKRIEELISQLIFVSKNPSSPAFQEFTVGEVVNPILEEAKKVLSFMNSRPKDTEDEIDPAPFIEATKKFIKGLQSIADFDNDRDTGRAIMGNDLVHEAFEEFKQIKMMAQPM